MSLCHFSDVIGQEAAVGHLQNALRTGRISHAYILCGEKGSGKHELAMAFADTLQCTDRQEQAGLLEPCGSCRPCLQAGALSQPDIITVRHEKRNPSDKSVVLGVDDIRRMRSDVAILPYSSDYKVYILPQADRMTAQAQNALLKTIEEPPAYAVIFLLAEGLDGFLPTVLSRCVTLRMEPVPEKTIEEYLRSRLATEPGRALLAARLSHGNPGQARKLASDTQFDAFRAQTIAFLKNLPQATSYEIAQMAEQVAGKPKKEKEQETAGKGSGAAAPGEGTDAADIGRAFSDLTECWFRDILVYKAAGDAESLIFQDEVQYIIDVAGRVSFDRMQRIQEAQNLAARRRERGGNGAQIMEMMLLEIRGALR